MAAEIAVQDCLRLYQQQRDRAGLGAVVVCMFPFDRDCEACGARRCEKLVGIKPRRWRLLPCVQCKREQRAREMEAA